MLVLCLWAHYPWAGGMSDFLRYTARWEQETVLKLKDKYLGDKKRSNIPKQEPADK